MNTAVREFVERMHFDRESVRQVETLLPSDDADLDTWLCEALASEAPNEFCLASAAAVCARRFVDARHLANGAGILLEYDLLRDVLANMQGDVPEYLLEAIRRGKVSAEQTPAVLFYVAGWCRKRRNSVFPQDVVPLALACTEQMALTAGQAILLA